MAKIVPFPLDRRRSLIQNQARYALELNPDAAERHIAYQLRLQGDCMRRKGITEDLIARELRCMEAAIRGLLLRSVSGGAQ